jgi:hypothetical protein
MTTDVRHNWGWKLTRSLQVPLLTEGDEHVGYFRAPAEAVHYKPHTNEILKMDRVVVEKVKAWVEWKAKQGWKVVGKPTVLAPVGLSTTAESDPLDDGDVRLYVRATFVPVRPFYMGLDDFLATQEDAERYEVPIDRGRHFENILPAPKEVIATTVQPGDAMEQAEARRKRYGLRRIVELDEDGTAQGRVEPDPNATPRGIQTVTERGSQ